MVRWGFMLGKPIERKLEEGLVDAILRDYDICNALLKPPRPFITLQAADAVLQELYQELHPGSPWPEHVNISHLITHSLRLVSLTQSPDPALPGDLALIVRQPQVRAVTQHLADAVLKLFGDRTFAQAAALNYASLGTKKILANSLKGKVSKAVLAELGRRRSKQVTLEEWQQLAERVRGASAGAEQQGAGAGVEDEGVGAREGSKNGESEESMLLAVAQVAASKSFEGAPDLAVPVEKALEIASTHLQRPLTREQFLQLLASSLLGPRFSNFLIVINYPDNNTQHVAINMPAVMQVVDNDYDTPDESSDHSSDGQEPDILAVTQVDSGMDIILDGSSNHTNDSPNPDALGMPSGNVAPDMSVDVMKLANGSLQAGATDDDSDSTEVGVETVSDATDNVGRNSGLLKATGLRDMPPHTGLNVSAAVFNMVSSTRPPSELSRHLNGSEVCTASSTTSSMPSTATSCGFSSDVSNHMGNFSIETMGSYSVGNMGSLSAESSTLMGRSPSGVASKSPAHGPGMVANNSLHGAGSSARGWQPQAAMNIPTGMQTRYSQPWSSWSQYQSGWSPPQAGGSHTQIYGSPSSLTWAHSQPTWQQFREPGSQAQQIGFHSPQLGSQFAASWSRFQLGASQLDALASHSPIAPPQYQAVWPQVETSMPLSGHARLPMAQSSLLTPARAYRIGVTEAKPIAMSCRGVVNLPDASELGPCFS